MLSAKATVFFGGFAAGLTAACMAFAQTNAQHEVQGPDMPGQIVLIADRPDVVEASQATGGAQMLIGQRVYDVNREWVGDVAGLRMTDPDDPQLEIEVGGFLGIGVKTVLIDVDRFEVDLGDDGDVEAVMVEMTIDDVQAMPPIGGR